MPFTDLSPTPGARGGTADALAHDITTRLAQLRSLFVIAQGSMFALHARSIGAQEAGQMLQVDFVVSGTVRRHDHRLVVTAELADARTARIVWAEIFDRPLDDAFRVLDDIGSQIVATAASEIETTERRRALLKPPNSLDAWEATTAASTAPSGTATIQPFSRSMSTAPRARWAVNERIEVGTMIAVEVPTARCMMTAGSTPATPNTW